MKVWRVTICRVAVAVLVILVSVPSSPQPASAYPVASEQFDTLPSDITVSSSASVYLTSTQGSPAAPALRGSGSGDSWYFNAGSRFDIKGDFDVTYDVYFPASSGRDIANFGFWLNTPATSLNGFLYRVQSTATDSGFFVVNNGGHTMVAQTGSTSAALTNVWYRVAISARGTTVNARVVNRDTGVLLGAHTADLATSLNAKHPQAGTFGQKGDAAGSTLGHYWDNIQLDLPTVTGIPFTTNVDPLFSFEVSGRSTSCSGAPLSSGATSGASAIDFGRVTMSTSAQGAQTLSVASNGGFGHSVQVRSSGPLTNGDSTIADISPTNATPGAFPSSGFGYTTTGTLLQGASTRFSNAWAGLTNANMPVSERATSTTTPDVFCVGYQVGIDATNNAGAYSTTVIYTAVPSF